MKTTAFVFTLLLSQSDTMCLTRLGAHTLSLVGDPVRGAAHQQPVHDGPGRGRWQNGERCRRRRRRGLLRVFQGTEPAPPLSGPRRGAAPSVCKSTCMLTAKNSVRMVFLLFFFFTFSSPSTSWLGFWVFTRDRILTGCSGLHAGRLSCPTKRAPSVAIIVAEPGARPPPGSTAWWTI